MENTRLNKIERLIQKDLGEIFRNKSRILFDGAMITVTKVLVSKDLSHSKVYLSLYATKDKLLLINKIKSFTKDIRREFAVKAKHQLRIIPELDFIHDDSLDYIDNIDKLLKQS